MQTSIKTRKYKKTKCRLCSKELPNLFDYCLILCFVFYYFSNLEISKKKKIFFHQAKMKLVDKNILVLECAIKKSSH